MRPASAAKLCEVAQVLVLLPSIWMPHQQTTKCALKAPSFSKTYLGMPANVSAEGHWISPSRLATAEAASFSMQCNQVFELTYTYFSVTFDKHILGIPVGAPWLSDMVRVHRHERHTSESNAVSSTNLHRALICTIASGSHAVGSKDSKLTRQLGPKAGGLSPTGNVSLRKAKSLSPRVNASSTAL